MSYIVHVVSYSITLHYIVLYCIHCMSCVFPYYIVLYYYIIYWIVLCYFCVPCIVVYILVSFCFELYHIVFYYFFFHILRILSYLAMLKATFTPALNHFILPHIISWYYFICHICCVVFCCDSVPHGKKLTS